MAVIDSAMSQQWIFLTVSGVSRMISLSIRFYNTVTRLRKKSCMIPETDRLIVDTSEAGAGASAVMYSIVETAKSKQSEYFPISLYGTAVYDGLYELVRRYRTADAME